MSIYSEIIVLVEAVLSVRYIDLESPYQEQEVLKLIRELFPVCISSIKARLQLSGIEFRKES